MFPDFSTAQWVGYTIVCICIFGIFINFHLNRGRLSEDDVIGKSFVLLGFLAVVSLWHPDFHLSSFSSVDAIMQVLTYLGMYGSVGAAIAAIAWVRLNFKMKSSLEHTIATHKYTFPTKIDEGDYRLFKIWSLLKTTTAIYHLNSNADDHFRMHIRGIKEYTDWAKERDVFNPVVAKETIDSIFPPRITNFKWYICVIITFWPCYIISSLIGDLPTLIFNIVKIPFIAFGNIIGKAIFGNVY